MLLPQFLEAFRVGRNIAVLITFPNSVVIRRDPSCGTIRKSPSELENALLLWAPSGMFSLGVLYFLGWSEYSDHIRRPNQTSENKIGSD
jgi:hypothetical protein